MVYTADGSALLLHAIDGIYVARPPDATPKLVLGKTCSQSKTKSLDCVRASKDGTRLAVLVPENGVLSLWDVRPDPTATDGSTVNARVATGVLDASVSPDGADLVYSQDSAANVSIDVFRVDAAGTVSSLVEALYVGTQDPTEVAGSMVVTPYGVAYPIPTLTKVEARFHPWSVEELKLGTLASACSGAVFPYCVIANADGTAVAWQDPASGVIHAYRPLPDLDLPLGTGYDFAFSRGGSTLLRMDYGPYAALVQRTDTAVVVREINGAISAELSADGESIAWLTEESKVNRTWRLWTGASRREGLDFDLGVVGAPSSRPLLAGSRGDVPLGHSFTGDARFIVYDAPLADAGVGSRLMAVDTETAEVRTLDTLTCSGCCTVAEAGALVACVPEMDQGSVSSASAVDLYDPATGLKTRASEKAILVAPFADGSGAAVMEYQGDLPELFLVFKDGRRQSKGSSLRVAASPEKRQFAWIDEKGQLSVDSLP